MIDRKSEVKLKAIVYIKTHRGSLGAIGLEFTNGISTPLFESKACANQELQLLEIDTSKTITSIDVSYWKEWDEGDEETAGSWKSTRKISGISLFASTEVVGRIVLVRG